MSDLRYIVADSGGTSTGWAFCFDDGTVKYRDIQSMHPKYLLEWSQEKLARLRKFLPDVIGVPLYFYGSGCTDETTAGRVQEVLVRTGFAEVSVFPDTLGACRACCGNDPGSVAILGTGSVLLEYDGETIVKRTGGWGSLIGDEGSGFHFGKLLVQEYLSGGSLLSPETHDQLASVIGTKEEVLGRLSRSDVQQWIADLGNKTANLHLEDIHRKNLTQFMSVHFRDNKLVNGQLHTIGSYGFHQRELLNELLRKEGLVYGNNYQSPLSELVKYHSLNEAIKTSDR